MTRISTRSAFPILCFFMLLFLPSGMKAQSNVNNASQSRITELNVHVETLTDTIAARSLESYLAVNYPGKIISASADVTSRTITVRFDSSNFTPADILQLLRARGYEGWYIQDARKGSLDAQGNLLIDDVK